MPGADLHNVDSHGPCAELVIRPYTGPCVQDLCPVNVRIQPATTSGALRGWMDAVSALWAWECYVRVPGVSAISVVRVVVSVCAGISVSRFPPLRRPGLHWLPNRFNNCILGWASCWYHGRWYHSRCIAQLRLFRVWGLCDQHSMEPDARGASGRVDSVIRSSDALGGGSAVSLRPPSPAPAFMRRTGDYQLAALVAVPGGGGRLAVLTCPTAVIRDRLLDGPC